MSSSRRSPLTSDASSVRLLPQTIFLLSLTAFSCRDLVVNEPASTSTAADFEMTWTQANNVYPFFQLKHINWDSIHEVYEPLAQNAKGDESLMVLIHLLAELKDSHVHVTTQAGEQIYPYEPPRTVRDRFAFDPRVVRTYFGQDLAVAGGGNIGYEMLPDSIGYIWLPTFSAGTWVNDVDSVLDGFRQTKGLIIDVRNNPGGMAETQEFVVERFIDSTLQYLPAYSRFGVEYLAPASPRGPFTYRNPVVILINGVSASAAEHFTEMMKQIPTVTALGDTTAGAGGNGGDQFWLSGGGEQVQLSTTDFRRYDGISIEWHGVLPNVVVMQTEKDIKMGRDLQLERAIKLLQ